MDKSYKNIKKKTAFVVKWHDVYTEHSEEP